MIRSSPSSGRHKFDSESRRVPLGATIGGIYDADFGLNTDLNASFLKLVLPLAVKHDVPKDRMIKRIFFFTDIQFGEANIQKEAEEETNTQASSVPPDPLAEWKTSHDVIAEAYAKAGYDVPGLVYWNLSNPRDRHGITTPVTGERQGVALLSGYPPSLLKLFMGASEKGWGSVSVSVGKAALGTGGKKKL